VQATACNAPCARALGTMNDAPAHAPVLVRDILDRLPFLGVTVEISFDLQR